MTRGRTSLLRRFRGEGGNTSIEFTIVVPLLLFVFMAVFEAGLFMVRYVMLDRAVDMMVRDLQIGAIIAPNATKMKEATCARTVIIPDCMDVLRLDLRVVDTANWTFPGTSVECTDRSAPVRPLLEPPTFGVSNQAMLLRACITVDPIFPTTGIGAGLRAEANGSGYYIMTSSAFANEP